jgi:hypothetical protein
MASIITPPCALFAARLITPVLGWFVLSAAFDDQAAAIMADHMRRHLIESFGRNGRTGSLPMTDLGDGRWLVRFVARQVPQVVNIDGRRLIVEPSECSVIQVVFELRPMTSGVGIIPIMQQVRILKLVEPAAED